MRLKGLEEKPENRDRILMIVDLKKMFCSICLKKMKLIVVFLKSV